MRTLGKRIRVVLLAIVLIEVLVVSSSLLEAPRYEASIKLLVGQQSFDAQNTRKESVRQAMRSLEAVGANFLGPIMTNVDYARVDRHYRHYGASAYEEF